MPDSKALILWLDQVRNVDVSSVGGKNASLGEMLGNLGTLGVRVPPGFATTATAYRRFVAHNGLAKVIEAELSRVSASGDDLGDAGQAVRAAFLKGEWPAETAAAIRDGYAELGRRCGKTDIAVAVRSSATAEDLPDASFAGAQETFLNISGEAALLDACRRCFASLFTDRAIVYRVAKGFGHLDVALSIGIERMVRSDLGSSGVMFTLDTETGFDKVVVINAAWGLGELVVQGSVDPDEYEIYKPFLSSPNLAPIIERALGQKSRKMVYATGHQAATTEEVATTEAERAAFVLSDGEILSLARWGQAIERHYGRPMDIEWAKDGESGEIFIVQARPETVQSHKTAATLRNYKIQSKGECLLKGLSIGDSVAVAPVCVIEGPGDIHKFVDGSILVTATTDPDWVPVMKRAAAIVTDHGGRTSHAAIVSRELGLPAVVGTRNATATLRNGETVTVSCAEGDQGYIYRGAAKFTVEDIALGTIPATRTKVMINLADPASASRWWRLPSDGVGLARMEFVIANQIRVHPMALAHFPEIKDPTVAAEIERLTRGYADKSEYFVENLACALAKIAAVHHPAPVIVRTSDFKTNEYAHLLGGAGFETAEENPMLGFRGASRYYSPRYLDGFALECRALRRLREQLGFRNVIVMIPFCRSLDEADQVLGVMAANGLKRGTNGLEVYMMCEIPANVILARQFADRFDGFSIGSNDLTQLTLGVDRDSELLAPLFDERNEAVKWMIAHAIAEAHAGGIKVGLCGQAPSDHPDFAEFLVSCGIDSISVDPERFLQVKRHIAAAEKEERAAAS
ncbi:phosphoenolpyruvate synthase [Dongia sp.]|uniref:phosphoenolpyruvate synthase n=1 Tax=Dongia sp. TaxID=1977262 RepID=UPI003753A706